MNSDHAPIVMICWLVSLVTSYALGLAQERSAWTRSVRLGHVYSPDGARMYRVFRMSAHVDPVEIDAANVLRKVSDREEFRDD